MPTLMGCRDKGCCRYFGTQIELLSPSNPSYDFIITPIINILQN